MHGGNILKTLEFGIIDCKMFCKKFNQLGGLASVAKSNSALPKNDSVIL